MVQGRGMRWCLVTPAVLSRQSWESRETKVTRIFRRKSLRKLKRKRALEICRGSCKSLAEFKSAAHTC